MSYFTVLLDGNKSVLVEHNSINSEEQALLPEVSDVTSESAHTIKDITLTSGNLLESKPCTSTGRKRTRNSPEPKTTQPTGPTPVNTPLHKQNTESASSSKKQKTVKHMDERTAMFTAKPKAVCPNCNCTSIKTELISLVQDVENKVFSIVMAKLEK